MPRLLTWSLKVIRGRRDCCSGSGRRRSISERNDKPWLLKGIVAAGVLGAASSEYRRTDETGSDVATASELSSEAL